MTHWFGGFKAVPVEKDRQRKEVTQKHNRLGRTHSQGPCASGWEPDRPLGAPVIGSSRWPPKEFAERELRAVGDVVSASGTISTHRMENGRTHDANRRGSISDIWLEQDPPVPEQGGVVPENRMTGLAFTPLEQVEQGNYVSANKETGYRMCSRDGGNVYTLFHLFHPLRDPLRRANIWNRVGLFHPVPPREVAQ